MKRETLEKVFEYASMPVHGTLSRKLRKEIKLKVNDGPVFEGATVYLGEEFVRITEDSGGLLTNTYYDWDGIYNVTTISASS